ncbi:MAG: adenosylcobinamide-GDP ribazoletransferase, partial [Halieaceae bacterium]|nr:adenosylcobinamide-GDP ribazoletransferase [Halieaceae bacterium]
LLIGLGGVAALFLVQELFSIVEMPAADSAGNWLAALLTIGLIVLVTGGTHLDGLADTTDAMASRRDRAEALDVMRRSDLGPMGAIALLFLLSIQVTALVITIEDGLAAVTLVTAVVTGRVTAVWACRLTAARPEGLGAWVAGSVTTLLASVVTVSTLLIPVVMLYLTGNLDWSALSIICVAMVIAIVLGGLLQRWWSHRFGGITGDTIGAGIEIATATTLVITALAG